MNHIAAILTLLDNSTTKQLLIKELFKLRPIGEDKYSGFLYPSQDDGIFEYDCPCFCLDIYLINKTPKVYSFFACISSIDDSGVSIFGREESYDKAKSRLVSFKEWIEGLDFQCPTKQMLTDFCETQMFYPDYW